MSTGKKKENRISNDTMKRILGCIKPYSFFVLLSLIFAIVTVVFTLRIPILIGHAVDCIAGQGAVDFDGLKTVFIHMVLAIAATALAQWIMNHINNKITFLIVRDLRISAFTHLQDLPLSYIDSQQSGDLLSRIIPDIEQFSDGLLMGFTQLFTGILTIIGTILFMLTINPMITLVVVVLTPVSFLIAKFISSRTYTMFRKQSEARGELTGLTNEMVSGIKVVQAFDYQDKAQEQFDEINGRLAEYGLQATFFSSLTNPTTRFYNSLIYAGVTIAGCLFCMAGPTVLTIGELSSFLSYTSQYAKPFNEITGVITEFQNSLACAARVFELLDAPAMVPDAPDAASPAPSDLSGAITLEHVDFSYNPETSLIRDLNLNVKPGQKIAIVGPTGCGKTTLINLLMRFYDVDEGCIRVDGCDVRQMTRESLRSGFGMVLQDTWLKSGTIRDNISYGRPDASIDEIQQAAQQAHAHSFIRRLPKGYDTVLGEDGGSLSQGQKQLLCIARIMLSLPPMLILDEATSSIDTMTEIRIQKAFAELMKGRTSFIVAHRLSTIREADRILVMKDGTIIEQGTHEELLARGGFYSELYQSQFAVTE